MKRLFNIAFSLTLLVALSIIALAFSVKTNAVGDVKQAKYTVTSTSVVSSTGDIPEGSSVEYSSTYSSKCQLTGGNSMKLTLSGYDGLIINSITLSMKSNGSSGAGYLDVKVGDVSMFSIGSSGNGVKFNDDSWNGSYSTTYVDVKKTVNAVVSSEQNVTITIGATENSLYCESFVVEYEPYIFGYDSYYSSLNTQSSFKLDYTTLHQSEYTKVSSLSDLDVNAKYVIANEEFGQILDGTATTIAGLATPIAVSFEDGKISKSEVNDSYFTLRYNNGLYAIRNERNFISSNGGNDINFVSEITEDNKLTISFDTDGNVVISSVNDGYQMKYKKAAGDKPEKIAFFKANTSEYSTLQLYKLTEYTINRADMRFGVRIAGDAYDEANTYGVLLKTNVTDEYDFITNMSSCQNVVCAPAKVNANGIIDANGNYYQYFALISNIPATKFDTTITAVAYVKVGDAYYLAKPKTFSINTLAKYYLDNSMSDPMVSKSVGVLTWLKDYVEVSTK